MQKTTVLPNTTCARFISIPKILVDKNIISTTTASIIRNAINLEQYKSVCKFLKYSYNIDIVVPLDYELNEDTFIHMKFNNTKLFETVGYNSIW